MSVFQELSQIDVSSHLEEKSGLSYLQWAAAWSLAKGYDPDATYEVLTSAVGQPYFNDPVAGAFVAVAVTIKGIRLVEYLPVLDYRNKAVQGENLNVFDINSAVKRCLVKCLAMHGLGIQVYIDGTGAGLDLAKGLKKKPKAAPAKAKTSKRSF